MLLFPNLKQATYIAADQHTYGYMVDILCKNHTIM